MSTEGKNNVMLPTDPTGSLCFFSGWLNSTKPFASTPQQFNDNK